MKSTTAVKTQDEVPGEWFDEVRRRAEETKGTEQSLVYELRHPEKAARALWMLAQGISKNRISQEVGIQRDVIRRMAWRHADTLETKKKEFSREFAIAAETYKDLLLERADQLAEDPSQLAAISPDKLALTMAICTDKSAMLAGMAGVVVEHRRGASVEDANEMIQAARRRLAEKNQVVDAEVIDTSILPKENLTGEPDMESDSP